MIVDATRKIIGGGRLSFDDAAAVMGEIMDGSPTPAQFGAFVAALSVRGETSEEIAGMATVMRSRARQVDAGDSLVDTCGTGGDGQNTYNISTAAAFVVAGRGRQGRQARQSRGDESVRQRRRARSARRKDRSAAGSGCRVHPPRRRGVHVCPNLSSGHEVRRASPARNRHQDRIQRAGPAHQSDRRETPGSRSRPRPIWWERWPKSSSRLGAEHALVVHGKEGLDELSISGPTLVADARDGRVSRYEIEPGDVGLKSAPIEAIAGGDPEHNASIVRSVLGGEKGPRRDVLLINAGAGIFAAGLAPDIAGGVRLAAESIDGGRARAALESLVELSNGV